ncbi:hypothetical protein SUGI_0662470 [Cryptomeria japonica]|uniref:mavicyanin n=1 Tax=Cryptomeria japonica TaxID=3369 RepID=UPI00241492DE|nr:mavicyanin [Cryptomeria japonica]GLJ32893.1 hypothetical protein SUGI_0662470 [Cryptomeria japonica]
MALNKGLLFWVAFLSVFQASMADQIKVGGTGTWDKTTNYQNWADSTTFHVGDSIAFTYNSAHSVVETDSMGFQSCTPSTILLQDNSGSTVVPLKTEGTHYFICNTPGHCSSGMKFSVTVLPSTISPTTTTPTSTEEKNLAATVAPPKSLLAGVGIMGIAPFILFI